MKRTTTIALRFGFPPALPLGTLVAGPHAQRSALAESFESAVYGSGIVYLSCAIW